jgi:ribose/xylose/arabinose/galactoside ABC-type transport system permease subunit
LSKRLFAKCRPEPQDLPFAPPQELRLRQACEPLDEKFVDARQLVWVLLQGMNLIVFMIFGGLVLAKSRYGQYLYAIGGNPEAIVA